MSDYTRDLTLDDLCGVDGHPAARHDCPVQAQARLEAVREAWRTRQVEWPREDPLRAAKAALVACILLTVVMLGPFMVALYFGHPMLAVVLAMVGTKVFGFLLRVDFR